jgi:hypothetical protein
MVYDDGDIENDIMTLFLFLQHVFYRCLYLPKPLCRVTFTAPPPPPPPPSPPPRCIFVCPPNHPISPFSQDAASEPPSLPPSSLPPSSRLINVLSKVSVPNNTLRSLARSPTKEYSYPCECRRSTRPGLACCPFPPCSSLPPAAARPIYVWPVFLSVCLSVCPLDGLFVCTRSICRQSLSVMKIEQQPNHHFSTQLTFNYVARCGAVNKSEEDDERKRIT